MLFPGFPGPVTPLSLSLRLPSPLSLAFDMFRLEATVAIHNAHMQTTNAILNDLLRQTAKNSLLLAAMIEDNATASARLLSALKSRPASTAVDLTGQARRKRRGAAGVPTIKVGNRRSMQVTGGHEPWLQKLAAEAWHHASSLGVKVRPKLHQSSRRGTGPHRKQP